MIHICRFANYITLLLVSYLMPSISDVYGNISLFP